MEKCRLNPDSVLLKKQAHSNDKEGRRATNCEDDILKDHYDESLAAKPIRKCPFLEKCTRLEKKNQEMDKKLKRMEKYSKGCKAELQRFVKRFNEFKHINIELDTQNKQLLIKNQLMRQRITDVLQQNKPHVKHQERITICDHQSTQQQIETEIIIENAAVIDRRSLRMAPEAERKILKLQQENQALQVRLDRDRQVMMDAVGQSERVQKELESCLLTVQTERNLLREEVKRLHEDYISLTDGILEQLKIINDAALLKRRLVPRFPEGGDLKI
ncbi:hypothetical protein DNTS_004020 [Danionella cerebrum]|uniref:Uncharacterized protein n=1 Tax=Danionella cerebrum TaxID=2873325 RepID=A0A553Q4S1_9TELE|nr:hypothetical protein DNTS_004020 [Danionella translucida]